MTDQPVPTGRLARILLVEDNYGDVLLAKEAFKSARVANEITVAEDGVKAMQILRREPPFEDSELPDMVLLDLNLPRKDGREVLEEIKSDPVLKIIPVVILTGSRAQTEIVRSYTQNANAYIVKPVTFDRLREVVAAIEQFWYGVVIFPAKGTKT